MACCIAFFKRAGCAFEDKEYFVEIQTFIANYLWENTFQYSFCIFFLLSLHRLSSKKNR